MARMNGFSGGLSGKVGSVVFRQNHGETIASQYQPHVSNPNTEAQAENRGAFKLISQLGAELAPAIAIARQGAASPRNIFTQKNLPSVTKTRTEDGAQAVIDIKDVQLTNSEIVNETVFTAVRAQAGIFVTFSQVGDYDRIVLTAVSTPQGSLAVTERPARLVAQKVYTPTADPTQSVEIELPGEVDSSEDQNRYVVLAYGVKFTNGKARERFDTSVSGNYQAGLNISRTIDFAQSRLSKTNGINVPASL